MCNMKYLDRLRVCVCVYIEGAPRRKKEFASFQRGKLQVTTTPLLVMLTSPISPSRARSEHGCDSSLDVPRLE